MNIKTLCLSLLHISTSTFTQLLYDLDVKSFVNCPKQLFINYLSHFADPKQKYSPDYYLQSYQSPLHVQSHASQQY